ncbi:Hpt domain-containing protein [Ramlibacter sp. MMS24-I3-19]|uniref:hybrid sensor histidine kinase/response regulator n=1 Tax=Ramlibacter sp. MMS24-I3-19 TaxID=3416606 RepID=UPI003D012749
MEAASDIHLATNDLGPLAWVLDELRKSLESASGALRRFVRDAGQARGSDMASVDTGQLRIARQQLHQAVGALEMVGLGAPAQILRAMESAVQKFVERPELCSEAAAAKVERAGFALTEFLEAVLHGKGLSPVALFPQYKDVQELAGGERNHPADLWDFDWRWLDAETPASEPLAYEASLRSRMDQAVLRIVKSADAAAARDLARCCHGLAAAQEPRQPKVFWKLAAAYFEALALGLLPADVYVKRAASRVLMQYATLAKGDLGVSDRLAQDLLFFCAQAVPPQGADAPALLAARAAYGLDRFKAVDYAKAQFGRFDPVLLTQARKRINAAKETWSALSGGDAAKLKPVAEQFHGISDSLTKLHPPSAPLAKSLSAAVDAVVRSGQPPRTEIAMEVATAVLYLEAAFQDLDPTDVQLPLRTARLAERLDQVRQGGQAQALEPWMEELYRRVSDRQTMGSVVGELRGTLSELEKVLDAFFRNPQDKAPLQNAPTHLLQMRGVLSVLGLDHATQAVARMRETLEQILVAEGEEDKARAAGTFEKLGNNLGALGFLIDMLNYQPTLAKKLFVYDEQSGELRPLMGRIGEAPAVSKPGAVDEEISPTSDKYSKGDPTVKLSAGVVKAAIAAMQPPAAPAPAPTAPPVPASAPVVIEEVDAELLDIFIEEAREVVGNGLAAIEALVTAPSDVGELTTLRRAFHTLKGSSRMVGLNEFGEAGWAMEQVLNTWLADQKPASEPLRTLAAEALRGFGRWIEDVAGQTGVEWKAAMFRGPADALRVEGRLLSLVLPKGSAATAPVAAAVPEPSLELPATELPSLDLAPVTADPFPAATPAPLQVLAEPAPASAADFAFDLPDLAAPDAPLAPLAEVADFQPSSIEMAQLDAALSAPADPVVDLVLQPEPAAVDQPPAPVFDVVAEPVVTELPADFDFDLEFGTAPAKPAATPVLPPELSDIDFGSLAALSQPTEAPVAAPVQAPAPAPVAHVAAPVPAMEPASGADEQVKVIGGLRIGIPLYNVYLNEADEWSRRLATEVAEWALELNRPMPDSAVGLAHALAGSSATVGFHALSEIARALEGALQHQQTLAYGTPQHGKAFVHAAEDIRRLLHQFAAGFLKEPDSDTVRELQALASIKLPSRADLSDSGPGELDDEPQPQPQAPTARVQAPPPARASAAPVAPVHVGAPSATRVVDFAALPKAQPTLTVSGDDRDDDDLDVADAIDPDLFPIFEEEAVELMPQLGTALRVWSGGDRSGRDQVLRVLHTLKGSARLAGALRLGELAHRMESAAEHISADSDASHIEPLVHHFDQMQTRFDKLRDAANAPQPEFVPEPLAAAPAATAAPIAAPMPAPTVQAQAPAAEIAQPTPAPVPRSTLVVPTAMHQPIVPRASGQAVRVRSQLLDRLMNQAGEVMITRSRLENELRTLRGSLTDLTGNLDRLRTQLRDIEVQAESQMQSRLAQAKDTAVGFDPLEFDRFTRVQELTRMMAESVNDVATVQRNLQRAVEATEDDLIAQARQTRELQRDLLRTRMVEFEAIADRLYRVVRLASKETGKQVKLDITGGSIEMDRGVLDRMTPAFEHLLRNCVAHGVEEPGSRTAAGKDATGTILINLAQEGNDVSVEFRDDGAGLNLARIREKAIQQGMVSADQPLTDADAANLIFMPGFSTATQVTELAGRGIGMDVVRSEVNALGGRIETSTQAGRGTSFKLVLPLTTAVTQVVMVRTGSLAIGVPANLVETVRRAPAKEVQQAYNTGTLDFGGEQIAFFWSGALLQASPRSTEPQGKTLPIVVFRSAAQRVAVHVDEILGNQEVVVKNLGPQLARLPGLAGMTVLASGAVVLIYNPVALSAVYGEQARLLSADNAQPEVLEAAGGKAVVIAQAPAVPQVPLVLVVDDSITVRRVTQRLLQREGYRVALAADGLQALERLAEERPAVVLSDIEMPRMDGFDLARNIRADARWASLPIVMITSRIAEKHREHARELGVNHYLGKPYSEEELLSLVKHYCIAPTPAA